MQTVVDSQDLQQVELVFRVDQLYFANSLSIHGQMSLEMEVCLLYSKILLMAKPNRCSLAH